MKKTYILFCLCIAIIFSLIFFVIAYINKIEKKRFMAEVSSLKKDIRKTIRKQKDFDSKCYCINLLKKPIKNRDDLEELRYLYHGGLLRTYEELDSHKYYKNRSDYDKQRHSINAYLPLTSFILSLTLIYIKIKNSSVFSVIFALIPATIIALISAIIGYLVNISSAKDYDISEEEPLVQEEIFKMKSATTASVIGGVYTYKHTKRKIKEFADVDSWEEMK